MLFMSIIDGRGGTHGTVTNDDKLSTDFRHLGNIEMSS